MGECAYFKTVLGKAEGQIIAAPKDSFASLTILSGEGTFNKEKYRQGDTFFIPAGKGAPIEGCGEFILTIIP